MLASHASAKQSAGTKASPDAARGGVSKAKPGPRLLPKSAIPGVHPPLAPSTSKPLPSGSRGSALGPAGKRTTVTPPFIRAGLKQESPGNSLEREADRVADHVTRTPDHVSASTPPRISAASGAAPASLRAPAQKTSGPIGEVLSSPGQPLGVDTRAFFESRFAQDFSAVRIHTDSRAAQSAIALNAVAYTAGPNVAFAHGQFAPDTPEGRRLIAHELTHVVQQRAAGKQAGDLIQRKAEITSPLVEPQALVDRYAYSRGHDEFEGISHDLYTNFIFRGLDYNYVEEVIDILPSSECDNVGALFIEMLFNTGLLDHTAASFYGRHMLTILYNEIMTGSVSDFERLQGTRILEAKLRQMKPEDYLASTEHDPRGHATQIFPIRFMRVTPWADDAPFEAKLTDEGKIWVKYPFRVKGTAMFAADFRTLQGGIFLSEGETLNPNEIVGIRDYEQGGKLSYLPALALIDYANQSDRSTMGKIVEVSITAFTLGYAAPAAGAAEGGAWAARLAVLDKIANVVQVVTFFVDENRDWIIEHLGWAGKALVKISDVAGTVVAVYGIGRLGQAGFKLAKDLRAASKAADQAASALSEISSSDAAKLAQLDSETDALIQQLEQAQKEVDAAVASSTPGKAVSGPGQNVPASHSALQGTPANDVGLPDVEPQAAEVPLQNTGTGDAYGTVVDDAATAADDNAMQMGKKGGGKSTKGGGGNKPPRGPKETVADYEKRVGPVKRSPPGPMPPSVEAQPKGGKGDQWKSHLDSDPNAPEVEAVNDNATPHQNLSDYDSYEGDSKLLGERLEASGFEKPGKGYEAHHIIPANEPAAEKLRQFLRKKGLTDINDAENGVWLARDKAGNLEATFKHEATFDRAAYKEGLYTSEYFKQLDVIFMSDPEISLARIRLKLRAVRASLLQGKMPPSYL